MSVQYRLAPETPYPGPLDDCYAGLAWVHQHADELGVDPDRIGIGGQSAGGGLAAGLALLARDRGEVPVAFQLLIYPMLDDRQITPSSGWPDPIWPPSANTYGWTAYLGDRKGGPDVEPYAAPARATDLAGLPPTLIAVGAIDGFSDEDIDYAVRLRHAGVPVDLHVYAGAPHGFEGLAPGCGRRPAGRPRHRRVAGRPARRTRRPDRYGTTGRWPPTLGRCSSNRWRSVHAATRSSGQWTSDQAELPGEYLYSSVRRCSAPCHGSVPCVSASVNTTTSPARSGTSTTSSRSNVAGSGKPGLVAARDAHEAAAAGRVVDERPLRGHQAGADATTVDAVVLGRVERCAAAVQTEPGRSRVDITIP